MECSISRLGRASKEKSNDLYQIVLLATSIEWYRNLIQIVTISQLEWYYIDRPRVDLDLLRKYHSDIIALSGNHLWEIAQHITTGRSEEFILERIREYQDIFGRENYYLEVMSQGDIAYQGHINDELIRIAAKYSIPIVATHNVFYSKIDLSEPQDYLQAIASGRSIDDPDRPSKLEGNHALLSEDEMKSLWVQHPELLDRTQEIVDRIDINIPYGLTLIPQFPLSDDQRAEYEKFRITCTSEEVVLDSEEWLLRSVCISGMLERYEFSLTPDEVDICIRKKITIPPDKKLKDIPVEELIQIAHQSFLPRKREIFDRLGEREQKIFERLEYELTVVNLMGFNGYFNIVSDYIQWAKDHDIPVGPGRGSAAWAVLAYVSKITDVEPIRYGLLFERFLNPARVSMPDIDVDFADDERERVLEYVSKKYGADHVAQVCTFGTMAAKAAFKDVGKALGIPFAQMNTHAKLIPAKPGTTIESALNDSPEFKTLYDEDAQIHKVVDTARILEGTVRQLGVHACAVIIAPEPMTNYCPLQHPPKDSEGIVTQFSQKPLEDLGLLKMDFLGLRNLSIMKRALAIIKDVHDVDVDLLKISFEDPKVFEIFANGDTTWVFQFESTGMRKYLRELKPSVFEDVIAMVSLYRPGPLKYIPTFIARKHGKEIVKYPHPSLEAILAPTYGIAVYQEQIMALVQAFAWFSLAQADILRRAIWKKLLEVLMEQKQIFINAAKKEWHPEDLAVYIFDDIILPFADYGFNKSHAACYSLIAYQTAYLKAYYPTEFMTALMCSDEEDTDRIRMEIEECRSKKIEVLPPDINESRKHFTFLNAGEIRFGLKALKWLWDTPIQDIIEHRKEKDFEGIHDMIARLSGDVINKKSLEALIHSWCLDRFENRRTLIEAMPQILAYHKEHQKKQSNSQVGLFDMFDDESLKEHDFSIRRFDEFDYVDKMNNEIMVMWYPASWWPFRYLEEVIRSQMKWLDLIDEMKDAQNSIEDIDQMDESPLPIPSSDTLDDSKKNYRQKLPSARLIGYVESIRKMPTKTGKLMGVAMLSSVWFEFEMVVFPKDYDQFEQYLVEWKVLFIDGDLKIDVENNRVQILPKKVLAQSLRDFRARNERIIAHEQSERESKRMEQWESTYTIYVPPSAKKEDLITLKSFLQSLPSGEILITLSIAWSLVSTKISLQDTVSLKEFIGKLWANSYH